MLALSRMLRNGYFAGNFDRSQQVLLSLGVTQTFVQVVAMILSDFGKSFASSREVSEKNAITKSNPQTPLAASKASAK